MLRARGAFVFLKDGDRHFRFLDGTVLRMRTALALLTVVVVVAVVGVARRARAGDFYLETVSAVDGGSSPPTALAVSKYSGKEIAVRCNYDAYLKICESIATTCVATANNQFLDQGKTFPVCFPTDWGKASVLPSDAGVSTSCKFSVVTPLQTCPQ